MLPVDRVFASDFFAFEGRSQRGALKRDDCCVADFLRIVRLAKVDTGGHKVDEMAGLALEFSVAFFTDAAGPMGNERRADAALVHPMLVLAEWCVAGVGPGQPIAVVGVRAARHHSGTLFYHSAVARAPGDHVGL